MPAALGTGAERGGAALKSFLGRGRRADCHGGGGRRVSGVAGRAVSADFAFQTWACPRTSRRSWPADSPPGTAAARGTPASAAPRTQVSGAGRGGRLPRGRGAARGPGRQVGPALPFGFPGFRASVSSSGISSVPFSLTHGVVVRLKLRGSLWKVNADCPVLPTPPAGGPAAWGPVWLPSV